MLTSLHQALIDHLSSLETPILQANCVPQGQTFPYVTMDVTPALSTDMPGSLTLTAWCCGESAHADRLALAEELLALLPSRGTVLALTGGRAILCMTDERARCLQSGEALGVQLTWELRCFPRA